MPGHIGIVACSAEGAALCYRTICQEGPALLGPHRHPEVSLHTHSLGEYMDFIRSRRLGRRRGSHALLGQEAEARRRRLPDLPRQHLPPAPFPLFAGRSPLPWLHIAEEVAAEAARRRFKRVGDHRNPLHHGRPGLSRGADAPGIDSASPPRPTATSINEIIFDELVNGIFRPESVEVFRAVIEGMKSEGCDAVILGCTEIPLVVTPENSPLPVLDSTRLLARAALRRAVSGTTGGM